MQFYLKITSMGQKYGGFLLNATKIPLIVLCWMEVLTVVETVTRFQNRICIIESQEKENEVLYIA